MRAELSHSQLPLWIGQRLSPESPLYNMAFVFQVEGDVDPKLFAAAWQEVVDSHAILRTSFETEDTGAGAGRPLRRVRPLGCCRAEILDWRERESISEEALLDWARGECARPFAMGDELTRCILVRLSAGRTAWLINQHHLVTDATSSTNLFRAVSEAYRQLGDQQPGAAANIPLESPVDYVEAIASTLEAAETDSAETAREHWRERAQPRRVGALYGHSSFLGAERTTTASRRLSLTLDHEQTRRVAELANLPGLRSFSPEMSRFAVYAALLGAWLGRLSGARALGFDTPVAGRPTPLSRSALGPFIELFPFQLEIEPRDSFRSLGERALAETQRLLRHALPGLALQGLGGAGGESTSNVVLNFVPASFEDFAGMPTQVTWVHPGHGDATHSLRLQVHDFGATGSTTLHFDINVEALPESDHERAIEHFRRLLDACLENPDRELAALDILTARDRERLVTLDGDVAAPRAAETVIDAFLRQARDTPDAVALRAGEQEFSFRELERQTASLAAAIAPSLKQAQPKIAVLARRTPNVIVALIAALRAGAAYVPIDPSSPPARVRQLTEDSGAALLLADGDTNSGSLDQAGLSADRIRFIDELLNEESAADGGPAAETPAPDDLAYVIYTSGSTGKPKGVLVDHAGLADYVFWAADLYTQGETLRYALCTSLAVDLTVTTLYLPLVTGGTLEIFPETSAGSAETSDTPDSGFIEALVSSSCDVIKLTPAHLRVARRLDLDSSRLNRLIVGGEDLTTHLAGAIRGKLPDVAIYNEYGPTEAVVGCSVHRYDPARDHGTSVPIGRPATGVALRVLDDSGTPVVPGVPGELWISSPRLARGYHDRPELTAEAFRALPRFESHAFAANTPSTIAYRTGDLVRLGEDDQLEYLGRTDRQLKVSGMRAEPGEIEAALLEHPAITDCVVGMRTSEPAAERPAEARFCQRCGLSSSYPRASFDADGVCSICRSYDEIKEIAHSYFGSMDDLQAIFDRSRKHNSGAEHETYDCMMLLSGGKDSTYALCQLVEMGLSVLAFSLDNGFISEGAKDNMRRVTDRLGVPLELATTPAMNTVLRDSLERYSNVCHGCFKVIYTLSTTRAHELGIPIIVTGLSRGQMFETRLTEELFRGGRFDSDEVDRAVLAARKVYHRVDDAVSQSLDVSVFQDDSVFDEILYVDFYRYCDAGLSEVLGYLEAKMPWVRPEDTGRSTNCLINDIGIWVHKRERGFHNYALPYSWDVRMGHKTRSQALDELDDRIDTNHVHRTLQVIDYEPKSSRRESNDVQQLTAFYVTAGTNDDIADIPAAELRDLAARTLPAQLVPSRFVRLEELPLLPSGKLDESALPWDGGSSADGDTDQHVEPSGPVESFLAEVWEHELGLQGTRQVGGSSDFFALGGTSLGAMEVMVRLCQEFDIDLPLESPFKHRTLRELARVAEDKILADVASLSDDEQQQLLDGN